MTTSPERSKSAAPRESSTHGFEQLGGVGNATIPKPIIFTHSRINTLYPKQLKDEGFHAGQAEAVGERQSSHSIKSPEASSGARGTADRPPAVLMPY